MKRLKLLLIGFAFLGAISFPGQHASSGEEARRSLVITWTLRTTITKRASRSSRPSQLTRVGRYWMSWDKGLLPSKFLPSKISSLRRSMPWWWFRIRRRRLQSV